MFRKLFSQKTNYYKHLDGIRAIAVISVLLCHLNISAFSGGYVGVDIFFVISGFLITRLIYKELQASNNFDFTGFYVRRFRRIVPALTVTLSVTFLFAIWLLDAVQFNDFGKFLASSALSISNIAFYKSSGYFDILSQSNPVLHTWSLSVEEQFYLGLPLTLFIFYRFFSSKKIFLGLFIALVALVSFIANYIYIYRNTQALYFLINFRIFEFCIGSLTIFLMNYRLTLHQKEVISLIGLVFIVYAIFCFTDTTPFPVHNALFPTIGTALLIWAGDAKYIGLLLKNKIIRFIGLISYSLYLVHWPIIVFWKVYKENTASGFHLSEFEKSAIFLISIILATLSYLYVEQPFRKNIPTTRKGKFKDIRKFLITLLGIAAIGWWVRIDKNFWSWRNIYPEIIRDFDLNNFHQKNWGGTDYHGGYIYKTNPHKPAIIMMGDSHSGMINEGIVQEVAKPNDINIFTASGGGAGKYISSLLLPGISRTSKDFGHKRCDDDSRAANVEAVDELKKYAKSIFVYSASYASQLNRSVDIQTHEPLGINADKTDLYKDYKKFTDALDSLRKKIKGHNLVLIGAFPGGGNFNPLKCYSRLKWFPGSAKCEVVTLIKNTPAGAKNINTVLDKYSRKHSEVYFINPFDFMCSGGKCQNLDQSGNVLYSDGAHLSKNGSRYFMKKITPKILKILDETSLLGISPPI